jgi:ATP synthase protein I
MQSNDARMLLQCAVPTALAGVVAAVVSGVLAGGKGTVGAAIGAAVVILFMGSGLAGLQYTAKSYPHLFQAMGMLLYTTQILLLAIVLIVFKNTTLFHTRAFAFSLLAAALVWIAAQVWTHMRAKILYVEPQSSGSAAGDTGKANAAGAIRDPQQT